MKRNCIVSSIVTIIITATLPCILHGQELTPEQQTEELVAKEKLMAEQRIRPLTSEKILRPERARAVMPPLPHFPNKSNKKVATAMAVRQPVPLNMEASLPDYQLPVAYDCTTNTRITYGVPVFTDDAWLTSFYNWDISTIMFDPINPDQAAMSQRPKYYPTYAEDSQLWYRIPLTYNTNNDPVWYSLKFWYQFYSSRTGDMFVVGTENGSNWLKYTNLPSVSTWTRAKMLLPPYSGVQYLMFSVSKTQTSIPNTGPQAYIAAVQLCVIDTYPVKSDFMIGKTASNTVQVAWNTIVYPTQRWSLSFAGYVTGLYSTNIGTAVYITNNTAYATFPATNGARFYRMKHN